MNPWRLLDSHPKALSYFKVACIGAILSVGVTLANNERTDQRVNELASQVARQKVVALRQSDVKIEEAKDAARELQARQLRYTLNRNACQGQAFVLPLLRSSRESLATYKQAAKDESLSASAKARNQGRITDTERTIASLEAAKRTYGTIPEDFKCSTLPKTPPK